MNEERTRKGRYKMKLEGWPFDMSRTEQIQMLIDRRQPFAVASYTAEMAGVTSRMFEIILLQTYDDEYETSGLSLTKQEFNDLIRQFGMRILHEVPCGRIYGIDDSLHRAKEGLENALGTIVRIAREMEDMKDMTRDPYEKIIYSELRRTSNRSNFASEIETMYYRTNGIVKWAFNGAKNREDEI